MSYQKSWTLSYRNHVIRRLIDLYKFHSVRAAALPIAEMLATITPKFTANTIIVPIPTSHPHIRQRGFDHTALLARHLARLKECQTSPVLTRRTNTRQFGSSRAKRLAQAKQAFSCDQKLNSKTHYVILDDIYTSGASIHAAADLLRANSARKISVVILARQPDSDSDSNSDSNSKEPPRQTKFILK
ncbi:hypothetical protein FWD07_02935 [Candidatus Saccharibacteria bacterium]|nr:hypothetical protein [Candidatus Saccharibacteria bacterium]